MVHFWTTRGHRLLASRVQMSHHIARHAAAERA